MTFNDAIVRLAALFAIVIVYAMLTLWWSVFG